ncbi:hypothetical protein B5180_38650, partial [Streptomyces sp. BF-3]
LPNLTTTPFTPNEEVTRFDLSLHLTENTDNTLTGQIVYNPDLYNPTTIQRITNAYLNTLNAITHDPNQHLSELPHIDPAEHQQLTTHWNNTTTPNTGPTTITELFNTQL